MRELGAIERIATPSVEEFRERYVDKCRPVILEGAVRDWPAMQRWNGDGLVEHYGEHRVWVGTTLRTIRELVETIQTGGDARTDFTILQAPWLLRDLGVLPYLDPRKVTFINVWVGGTSRTNIHYDLGDNLHVVIRGIKRWYLVAPEEHVRLYPLEPDPSKKLPLQHSQIDFFSPDDARFPATRDVGYIVSDVWPGDVVYVPSAWWHAVEHRGDPTMAINYWWPRGGLENPQQDSFLKDRVALASVFGLMTGLAK